MLASSQWWNTAAQATARCLFQRPQERPQQPFLSCPYHRLKVHVLFPELIHLCYLQVGTHQPSSSSNSIRTTTTTTVDVVPAKLAAHFPVWATTPANLQWHPLLFYSDSFSVVQPKAKAKKRRKTTNARCSHPTAQQQRTNTHLFPLPLFETWHFWQRTSLAAMAQRL